MRLSSTGNVTHSIRSINVAANILGEWSDNQRRYQREVQRHLIVVAATLLTTALIARPLGQAVSRSDRRYQAKVAEMGRLQAERSQLEAENASLEPTLAASELRRREEVFFRRALGELYQVLDSAKSGMAFASVRLDVSEAKAKILSRGDAEHYDVVAAFADQAGSTNCTASTVASTRPNKALGPDGIGFEYVKQVPLE